jgi:hypothetical protein
MAESLAAVLLASTPARCFQSSGTARPIIDRLAPALVINLWLGESSGCKPRASRAAGAFMTDYSPEERQQLADRTAWVDELNSYGAEAVLEDLPEGGRLVGTPGGDWRQPQGGNERLIPPGQILTQYGRRTFREVPRFETYKPPEVEISMIVGQHTVDVVARLVTRLEPRAGAQVRYFRSDDLWLKNYLVIHTPREWNPGHASIYYREIHTRDQLEISKIAWSDAGRATLQALAISAGEALE